MAAAVAPMAGVEDWAGGSNGQAGKQAGPVEVLGRADTAAGRWRGGKPPERPPAAGPAPLADVAVTGRVPERGAGFCLCLCRCICLCLCICMCLCFCL